MFRVRPIATLSLIVGLAWSAAACSATAPASSATDNTPSGAAGTAGTGVGCTQASADTYIAGLKKPGVAAHFNFELVSSMPAPPAVDDNTFVVQVTDSDGKPLNGELSVALEMPEHGHPSPKQPDITFEPGTSAFTLQPMRLFMVGLWSITFSFASADTPATSDSAVFKFCVE